MERTRTDSKTWFDVLGGTERAQAASMTLDAGRSTGGPTNAHAESEQWCYVVSGTGEAIVEGETTSLEAGDLLAIEPGETHEITASENEALETLNLYVPPAY